MIPKLCIVHQAVQITSDYTRSPKGEGTAVPFLQPFYHLHRYQAHIQLFSQSFRKMSRSPWDLEIRP